MYDLLTGNVQWPVIIVGHGFGGYNARIFAAKYPFFVKGLLLIDPIHENQEQETWKALGISESEGIKKRNRENDGIQFMQLFDGIGLIRLLSNYIPGASFSQFTSEQNKMYLSRIANYKWAGAVASEFIHMPIESAQYVREYRGNGFENLPIIVLSSSNSLNTSCETLKYSLNSTSCKTHLILQNVTYYLQKDLTTLSTRVKWGIIDGGHHLPIEKPNEVISTFLDLYYTVKSDQS